MLAGGAVGSDSLQAGHRLAPRRRADARCVFGEHTRCVARRRRLPRGRALGKLVRRHVENELTPFDVDLDHVAVADVRERTAVDCLRGDVADHQPVRRAGEAAVGDEGDLVAEPLADERRGHVQHLAHSRSAGRPLVPDDDHVARHDRPSLDGGEAILLGVEHARGPAMVQPFVPCELDDAPVGRKIAAEDREAAGRLQRLVPRDDDVLARPLVRTVGDLAQRASVNRSRCLVHDTRPHELAGNERDAARSVQVGRDVAAARLDVGDDRRAC